MAYAERLRIEYDDVNGVATQIEVWQDGYTGAVELRDYAMGDVCCEVAWGDSSTKRLPTVYGSQVTFYFDSETNFEFHDFFTSNSRKNYIKVYKAGVLFFLGFGEADTWSEPYIPAPYDVSFTGYDGLGGLKDIDFLDDAREYYEGEMTPLAILQLVLRKTGLELPLNVATSIRPVDAPAAGNPLEWVLKDVISYRDMSCYEVLENLFQGCRIFQRAGEWFCVSHDKWNASSFNAFNYDAADNYVEMIAVSTEFSGFWFEGEGNLEFLPALKQMTIVQDYGFKSNLIDNGSFTDLENGNFDGWTAVGTTPEQRVFDADGNRYVYLPGSETPGDWEDARAKYLKSEGIRVVTGSSILNVSLSSALMGPVSASGYVFFGLRLTGDNGINYAAEAYLYDGDEGREVRFRWIASNDIHAVPVKSHVERHKVFLGSDYYDVDPDRTEAFPYDQVADNFQNTAISIDDGIPNTGTLTFYLFLTHSPNGSVAGNCFREISLKFADESDEALPTEKELVLLNDIGNNYVPDDLDLVNGDYPDLPNALTVYGGGFRLTDVSGNATTLWEIDGYASSYSYIELMARFIANEMRLARLSYNVTPADAVPGAALVFVDSSNSKRFIEAGITYNDRMQTITGRYVELVDLNLNAFTVGETIEYGQGSGSSSSGGNGTTVDTDERVVLIDSEFQKVSQQGYLSDADFYTERDEETGRSVHRQLRGWKLGEVLTGTIDGNNRVFTSLKTPVDTTNVSLFLAYAFPLKPSDFSINEKTWTLNANINAPADNECLLAYYEFEKDEE